MDLGIAGRWAIVCASTQGLGRACAEALAAEGVNIVLNGRTPARVEEVAEELATTHGVHVRSIAGDLTTPEGRAALIGAHPEPDILVTNNAGPAPGRIDEVTDEDLAHALELHYWSPISLVRGVLDGMQRRRFGRIVNITSAMVTTPRATMVASTGARTGMTAVMKAISHESVRHNVTINCLLPERIDTGRQEQMAHIEADRHGISYDEARRRQAASIAAGRHGLPSELGAACAFLCSVHASFISGVNLHLDGGSYPGLV